MHVVFDAALGAAIVQNLAQQNKAVRAVVRDVGRARKVLPSSTEILVADVSKPDSIKPAFQNASVIYHCVNVSYDKWTEVMPLVTGNILEGAIGNAGECCLSRQCLRLRPISEGPSNRRPCFSSYS